MKKELILFILFFSFSPTVGICGQTARQGPSPQTIIPTARKIDSATLPAKPQTPDLSPSEVSAQTPHYNPTGKPDPFMPTTVINETKKNVLPLEQFEVNEFELVGVVIGSGIKKAMVQDLTGRGYFIQVGTRIGKMGGKVIRISEKEVVVKEPFQDFLGRTSSRVITLKLPLTRYGIP
jgi:type IV pilus assembly protein PilP